MNYKLKAVPVLMVGLVFLGGVVVYGQAGPLVKAPETYTAPPVITSPDGGFKAPAIPGERRIPKIISGGVVNGFAKSLPKPVCPWGKKGSGVVGVKGIIDEAGNGVEANAVSGPELRSIRKAAEKAALKAKFDPTMISGTPVKVLGTINYEFAPAKAKKKS